MRHSKLFRVREEEGLVKRQAMPAVYSDSNMQILTVNTEADQSLCGLIVFVAGCYCFDYWLPSVFHRQNSRHGCGPEDLCSQGHALQPLLCDSRHCCVDLLACT